MTVMIDNHLFAFVLISACVVLLIATIVFPLIILFHYERLKRKMKSGTFEDIKRKKHHILKSWKNNEK